MTKPGPHVRSTESNLAFVDVNVLDTGARGDGVTDDTKAIQEAMNIAGSRGGNVIFPGGIYLISSPLVWDKRTETSIQMAPSLIGAPGRSGLSQSFGYESTVQLKASSTFPIGEFMIDYLGPTATDKCLFGFTIAGLTLHCNSRASGYRMFNTFTSTVRDVVITGSPKTPNPAVTSGSPAGAANHVASPSTNAWNNFVARVQITEAEQDGFFFNEGSGSYLLAEYCFSSLAGRYGFVIGDYVTARDCISKQSSNTATGGGDWKVQGNATLIGCKSPQAKPVNGSGMVLSLSSNQRVQVIGGELFGPTGSGLSDANGAAVRILQATGMSVEFIGTNIMTGDTDTKTFVYISASSTGSVKFIGCPFIQTNGAPATAPYILNSNKVIEFITCKGMNPAGAVTVTIASNAWLNANPYPVDIYCNDDGDFTGTTTITPDGGAAATVPNPVVGSHYRIPPYATITFGVGGSVTANPAFNGFGS